MLHYNNVLNIIYLSIQLFIYLSNYYLASFKQIYYIFVKDVN